MAEDPKRKHEQDLQSAREGAIELLEIELNAKMGRILRDLEIFEDDDCLFIFYQNSKVGEISCTWRKYDEWWKRPELHERADVDDLNPKRFFQKFFDNDETSATQKKSGAWEKGLERHEVEGLNSVTPKRFFRKIFGEKENLKLWLLSDFCNFCMLGLNQSYEKELNFKLTMGHSKGNFKKIRMLANEWNLALLGQVQTFIFTVPVGNEIFAQEDDTISRYPEITICRFNHDGNYHVNLYVLRAGHITTEDNLEESLCFSDTIKNCYGFYSDAIQVRTEN